MNSERWQDIYRRQPLPTELPAKFDEAAWLREIELDDFDVERGWDESDRRAIFSYIVWILIGIPRWNRDPWWGEITLSLWFAILAALTWRQLRLRRKIDRDYHVSLLQRVVRAEALLRVRHSFRSMDIFFRAPLRFDAGFANRRFSGPAWFRVIRRDQNRGFGRCRDHRCVDSCEFGFHGST